LRESCQQGADELVCIVCTIQPVKSSELIKLLNRAGWEEVAVRGSHHQFKHPQRPGRVTVPHPKKDLPIGTIAAILKQAGLKS
jgi:predicted RNA binding protein YcfA (HicA-like mRNA interferase family)